MHSRMLMLFLLAFEASLEAQGNPGERPVAEGGRTRPETASVNFIRTGEHIHVPVVVNGRSLDLVLDTGASHVALSPNVAESVKLSKSEAAVFDTVVTSGNKTFMGKADTVAVGSAVLADVPTFVIPVPTFLKADGFLGLSFLKAFVFRIDYPGRTLTLSSSQKQLVPEGNRGVALRVERNWLSVWAEVDGHPAQLVVDTGASQGLMLKSWFVDQHRLRSAYPRRLKIATGLDVAGLTRGELVRMKSLRVGGNEFRDLVAEWELSEGAAEDEFAGYVGSDVLSRLDLVFDIGAARLWATPNADFSRPPDTSATIRSGLMCLPTWEIVDVAADSPASEAGIRASDRVHSVEGKPVSMIPYIEFRELLRSKPGTRVRLEVRTGELPPREAILILRDLI